MRGLSRKGGNERYVRFTHSSTCGSRGRRSRFLASGCMKNCPRCGETKPLEFSSGRTAGRPVRASGLLHRLRHAQERRRSTAPEGSARRADRVRDRGARSRAVLPAWTSASANDVSQVPPSSTQFVDATLAKAGGSGQLLQAVSHRDQQREQASVCTAAPATTTCVRRYGIDEAEKTRQDHEGAGRGLPDLRQRTGRACRS